MIAEAMSALGPAAISDAELDATVSGVFGRPAAVPGFRVEPLPVNAMCTEAVLHLQGTAQVGADERPWDLLVKILRHGTGPS